MRQKEFHRSDDLTEIAFGTVHPALAAFPHCLFKYSKAAFRAVLAGVGGRAVKFEYESLMRAADGGVYFPTLEVDVNPEAYFKEVQEHWLHPVNQQMLEDEGWKSHLGSFSMVISGDLTGSTLAGVYQVLRGDSDDPYTGDIDGCLERLAQVIAEIQWVYVPLGDCEIDYAMFVASEHAPELVTRVRESLQRLGIEVIALELAPSTVPD